MHLAIKWLVCRKSDKKLKKIKSIQNKLITNNERREGPLLGVVCADAKWGFLSPQKWTFRNLKGTLI